jgi:hypothetical protein
MKTLRLWKKPPTTAKVNEDGEVGKFYGVDAFIVAGRVTGVAHGRRGVPFYGGPRYTITWENGEVDEEITATDLLNHYKETPQSLGCSNTLDSWLSDNLYDIATSAGYILEAQRVKTFLLELRQRIQRNNMKSNIIAEIGLESIASMINGTREISLVGYNTQKSELNTLADFFPVRPTQKIGKLQETPLQQTVYTIGQLMVPRTAQSELLVVSDIHNTDWIGVEMPVAKDFVWSVKANYDRYFVVMNRSKLFDNKSSELDLMVVDSVVVELSKAIRSLWEKETRKRIRKDVLKDLEHKLFEWKSATVSELCYNVIQHVSPHLAGADLYVGVVDPGGATITYVSSSVRSKMEGKVLRRGEGVSFDVVDTLTTIILRPEDLDKGKLLVENSIVDVMYGRKLHRARVEKVRGHEKFDVRYDCDHKVEAGVDASRIVPHSFAFRMKKFGKAVYPFVCVPLKNRSKALGVIGIDSFTSIPKADYEAHPDPDLVAFLEKVGAILGSNIDMQRKKMSMQVLYSIAKNQFTEVADVVAATFEVLQNNLTNIAGLLAARLVYEDAEPKRSHGLHVLSKTGVIPAEVLSRLEGFNPAKSSLKSVQKHGERVMWMLCRLRPAVRNEQGKIFIFCVASTTAISEPDQEYLSAVQKLIAGTLQNIVSFKAVTEMRYESLREIRTLCETANTYSRQKFFNLVVDSVQSCFYSANMYVGVLSPYNKSIDYILASSQSDMVGKSLVRADRTGVSFKIVDELVPVSVGPTSQLAFKLHHFGPRQQFEFPYIGIPLVVHVDAMIGVLGVDHCEDPAQVGDSLNDTTSFFLAVGNCLGQVVRRFREEDARARLQQIGRECKTYEEGIRQIKKVILEILPFAKRVLEIAYEPVPAEITQRTQADATQPQELLKQLINQTTESYMVVLQVPTAYSFPTTAATNVQLRCIWQGNMLFGCKVTPDGETKLAPVTVHIPADVSLDIVKVQFVLVGTIANSEREIAHKEIDLVYLLNAPLYLIEHYMESAQNPTARVARFQLLSKVFAEKQVVGFVVTEILVKGVNNLFETYHANKTTQRQSTKDLRKSMLKQTSSARNFVAPKLGDVFSVLRWNDEVVLKTPSFTPTGDLLWSNLSVYLKLESTALTKNQMQLEVWDQRRNGEPGTAYGRMDMDGTALQAYLDGGSTFLELGALFPEGTKTDATTAAVLRTNAVLKIKGKVVTATTMSEEHMKQEFSPSLRVKAKQPAEGAEKEKPFHLCEVCVIQARELGRRDDWPATMEPDVFAVVYFNGEEIGRTAVISGTTHPEWKEENFSLRVPGDDEIDQCALLVELYHLDPQTSVEEPMGRVEVLGKALANFLTSNRLKVQWFDVEGKPSDAARKGAAIQAQGELKLSGRPVAVEPTGREEAKDLGHMELNLLGFSNVRIPEPPVDAITVGEFRTFGVVYFNDRRIYRSKLVDGHPEGQWEKEKLTFRYPNSRPLFQCKLRVELWQLRMASAALRSQETLIGSVELTGSALGKVMGQKGLITKWLPVAINEEYSQSLPVTAAAVFDPEVQVKGGPLGGKDIYEDCDEQLLLDVLAATRLPLRPDSGSGYDRRPCTIAEITWNRKRVGRTAVAVSSAHPLWDKQRFVMRIPLLTAAPETSILALCKLRIDLYDVWGDGSEVHFGTMILRGSEIDELFGQSAPNVKWYALHTHRDEDGKLIEPEEENAEDAIPDEEDGLGAELKLRGAKTGVSDDAKPAPSENLLHVVSASDLSNTDIFGGADPFVTVEWLGASVGQTQIVPKTVNPQFQNEVFFLKQRLGAPASPASRASPGAPSPTSPSPVPSLSLCLEVYSKLAVASVPVFLGRVLLHHTELKPLLALDDSGPRQYALSASPELTDEENQLVKGALTVQFNKVKTFPHNIATKRDAMMWVVSAANLPKTSAFGVEQDVYCKVFRRADREGGDDVEIAETAVAKSLNPVFKESYIPLEIPAYDDWSGFQLRVEVWDAANEVIGAVILRDEDARAVLGRSEGDLLAPLTFALMDAGVAASFSPPASAVPGARVPRPPLASRITAGQETTAPTISLAGGIRELFDLALLKKRGVTPNAPLTSSPSISRIRSTSESDHEGEGGRARTSSKAGNDFSPAVKSQKGDEAIVAITALETTLEAKKFFCVVKWKAQELGRTKPAKLGEDDFPWRDEKIIITLDKDNSLSSSTMEIEVYASNKRDVPLGVVMLTSSDLAKLFDPALEQVDFPVIDYKTAKSILGRKKTVGTMTLDGCIPRVKQAYDDLHQEAEHAVVEQEDPELQPLEFEVELQRASRLVSSSKQVFATVHWSGSTMDPLGKTDVVNGSGHVEFDCEYFVVKKAQGVRLVDCTLRVCLLSKNLLTAHTPLGEVVLTGEALKAWVNGEHSQEFAVYDKAGTNKNTPADLLPALHMGAKKLVDASTSPMYNQSLQLPSHLIEIEVSVLAAHGLARVNTIGLSNPYCRVRWGRTELGHTTIVSDTLAPMWDENEPFTFRVPSSWDYKKGKRRATGTAAAVLAGPGSGDMTLTLAMYSSNRLGEDVFLGSAELSGEELVKFVSAAQYNRRWFNLRPSKRLKQKDQKFASGRVQVLVTHKPKPGEGDFTGKDVEVVVCAGRDLAKRKDNAAVDIFVRSRWNGKLIGKTFHATDCTNPVWEDERCHSRLPGSLTLEECVLELEVWQYQKTNSKSVLVGVVTLRDEELRNFVEASNFSPQWFPVAASPFTPTALLNTNVRNSRDMSMRTSRGNISTHSLEASFHSKESRSSHLDVSDLEGKDDPGLGQLQIRCGFAGRYVNVTDSMLPYELAIYGAKDLGKADMLLGLSDPFVICKWNGREIGRTPHASRTVHPTWPDQRFVLMLDPNEDIGQNLLQIEVWNHRVITKGEFLGCLYLTGPALVEWFDGVVKQGRLWSELTKSPMLEDARQHLVKGRIEVGFQVKKKDTTGAGTVRDALDLRWSEICADGAGQPMLMFKLLAVQGLPVVEGEGNNKGFLGVKGAASTANLTAALSWAGEEVARTSVVTQAPGEKHSAKWPEEEFHFRLPPGTDESGDKTIFQLQLLDVTSHHKAPVVLGKVEFTFAMLWSLYGGEFTFPLVGVEQESGVTGTKADKGWSVTGASQEIRLSGTRGSVTFHMDIVFPFWDSIRSIVPRTYLRKLSVCGATNLPMINDEPPNPKCVVMFDGAIKAKTIALLGSVAPNWPRVDVDIVIDKEVPLEVNVIVYHVSAADKKEILIGQEVIPFDYFLRPPVGQFDLFLGPSNKKQAEYKFTTSGSVRLQIAGSVQLSESSMPYSHRLEKPVAALVARDMRATGRERLTKLDHELNGPILAPEERHWLGTAIDFVNPQQIVCKPEWVTLPIQDMGMRVGPRRGDLIGTTPGFKMALCIEREEGRANVSDAMMLQSLTHAFSECVTQLRKKDIFRAVREKALVSLRVQVKEMATRADFSKDAVVKLIYDVVSVCLPGVKGRTAMLSQDARMIEYLSFEEQTKQDKEDSLSPLVTAPKTVVLYLNQGADWDVIGRTQNRSLVASKYADFAGRPVATFNPFSECRFPRFSVPLRSGDAAMGFFQLENFDVLAGGMQRGGLTEEGELRAWLEDVGDACGAAMYVGNEARVLANIDAFCQCWNSSINGLIADLVRDCFTVVQGCRLMEILSVDADYNIKSLLQSKPEGAKVVGNTVVFKSVTIKEHVAEVAAESTLGSRFGALPGAKLFRRRNAVLPPTTEAPSTRTGAIATDGATSSSSAAATTSTNNTTATNVPLNRPSTTAGSEDPTQSSAEALASTPKQLLVGVRYDGLEQVHTATYDSATRSYLVPEMHITLQNDRNVIISMYEVDDKLTMLSEHVGKVNFQTFQETELKGTLSAPVPVGCTATNPPAYDAHVELHWPSKFEFVRETNDHANIRGFKVHITRARDLRGTDSSGSAANPFCEVLYAGKVIKQTEPKKKTIAPLWNEDIFVPYSSSGPRSGLIVDVYDMSFMRKGEFLGRVEIPHDHLVNCNGQEMDFSLKPKVGVDIKKQTKVGGILSLSCTIVETAAAIRDREAEQSRKDRANAEIPKEVWDMLCPTLELTVKSATDLARANRFGGSSDPFVLVYVGNDADASEKTHFIPNTLNPKWNSVFNILLGVSMERGATQVSSFPTIRLEVYDYNKVKAMDFLGSCEIPPAVYFSRKEGDFTLRPIARKKNDLVKGKLQAEFRIVDKVVQKKEHVYSFTPLRTLQTIVTVDIFVMRAKGLMQANQVGNSDPYVVLKWNDQTIGQTSVKINTLNPVWNGEKFVLNVLTFGGFNVGEMTFEVWDKDFFKDGDFMGQAKVTSDMFMHPPPTPMDLALRPRPGDDPLLSERIQGTLTVKFVVRVVPQHPPCETLVAQEFKMVQPSLDPVTLIMAADPEQEAKRQKREGMSFTSIIEKASSQMEKYLNNPFERTGIISELHYGQLTAASRRAEQTVLKMPAADMVCMPTYRRGARPEQCFYIMARYEAGKIPRRDMQFLGKIHAMLNRGLTHINEREQRARNLVELEKGLELISTATDNSSGIVVQVLLDMELTLNCTVNLYLLGADGTTLTKCSPDIGEVDPETPPAEEYVLHAAQMCRYGFVIQKYRGEYSIINTQWEAFTQLTVRPLASMGATFDELEEPQLVKNFTSACDVRVPDGAIFAPLMAHGEVFMGLLVLTKVDAVPSANYRVLPNAEAEPVTTQAQVTQKQPYTVVEKMEHGFTNKVKSMSSLFADGIFSSRLGTVYRKIKSFPIKSETDPVMVIRYAVRLLVTAVPAIRSVGVWAVNLNKTPVLLYSKTAEIAPRTGVLNSLLTMSSRVSMRLSSRFSSSKKAASVTEETETAPPKRFVPSILSGVFGGENPNLLLAANVERAAIGIAAPDTTNVRQSAVRDHKALMADVKLKTTERQAKWRIDVPGALQRAVRKMGVETIAEDEDEDDHSSTGSAAGAGVGGGAGKGMGEADENAMNLVHAEITRYVCHALTITIILVSDEVNHVNLYQVRQGLATEDLPRRLWAHSDGPRYRGAVARHYLRSVPTDRGARRRTARADPGGTRPSTPALSRHATHRTSTQSTAAVGTVVNFPRKEVV